MLTLKVLSLLLSYPEAEMLEALDEMSAVVEQENLLLEDHKKSVLALIDSYRGADLLDLQEQLCGAVRPGTVFIAAYIRACTRRIQGQRAGHGQFIADV